MMLRWRERVQVELELLHVTHARQLGDQLEAAVLVHVAPLQYLQHVADLDAEHFDVKQGRVTGLEVYTFICDHQETTYGQLRSNKFNASTVQLDSLLRRLDQSSLELVGHDLRAELEASHEFRKARL